MSQLIDIFLEPTKVWLQQKERPTFLLPALLFHAYWSVPEAERMAQYLSFWKNVSIAGGMLLLAAFGAGRFSLDARRGG